MGISSEPGTQTTSTSASAAPCRRSPSPAPASSWSVMKPLKRATTIAKRKPPAASAPSYSMPIGCSLPRRRSRAAPTPGPASRPGLEPEQVPHLVLFRLQVTQVLGVQDRLDRDALHDLEPEAVEPDPLRGIVGHQADLVQAEVHQNLGANAVVPRIGGKPEVKVGLYGVHAVVLERVGLD